MAKGTNRFVPSGKLKALELREGSGIGISNVSSGRFRYNEIANLVELSENGGPYAPLQSGVVLYTGPGDGQVVATGTTGAGDATLTKVGGVAWTAADIGKAVGATGAGAAGATHVTTIASINGPNSIEMTAPATTAVVGASTVVWGTDNGGVGGLLDTAIAAIAGTGNELLLPAGIFCLVDRFTPTANDVRLRGSGKRETVFAQLFDAGGSGALVWFNDDNLPAPLGSTTLASPNVPGTATIVTVANVSPGTLCKIQNAGVWVRVEYRTVLTSGGGGGPFTLTMDKPLKTQFAGGAVVQFLHDRPRNVHLSDFGVLCLGGDRAVEIWGGIDCSIEHVYVDATLGAMTIAAALLVGLSAGCEDSVMLDVSCDCAADVDTGPYMRCCEHCQMIDCMANGVALTGSALYDCIECDVYSPGGIYNPVGLTIGADGNNSGCSDIRIFGGDLDSNTNGLLVTLGSSDIEVYGTSCRFCSAVGAKVDGSVSDPTGVVFDGVIATDCVDGINILSAPGVRLIDCDVSRCSTRGIYTNSPGYISGLRCVGSLNDYGIVADTGATDLLVDGFEIQSSHAGHQGVAINAGARVTLSNGHIQLDGNGSFAVLCQNTGVGVLDHVRGDGAGAGCYGWTGYDGSLVRAGDGCDFSTLGANGWWFQSAAAMRNRGEVVANGVAGINIAFTDIVAPINGVGDHVTLTRKTDGGTPGPTPRVTIVDATEATINATALDTSTYEYEIG